MWTYVCPGAGTVAALQPALAYAASDSVAHKVSRTVEGRLVIGTTNPGKTWALSYFNRLTFWNDVFLFFDVYVAHADLQMFRASINSSVNVHTFQRNKLQKDQEEVHFDL